ncbi:hypothetical protein [Bifidobacterium sp. ESL0732]|uniref:hypothetical protein n=1 Tax=Bifidobacterium sp. ESL0732 TaxID=2983222 RepID=UPI0023F7496A|nr:hypothetical protein [Bifidobacterium sp. ESL0732]WEV64075.1 hypothetical protein OZX70_00260 [Bifidobacterium sp. ESL0732]
MLKIREYVQEFVTRSAEGGDIRTDTVCKTPDETRDFFNKIFAEAKARRRPRLRTVRG